MTFEEEVEKADKAIEKGYLELVVNIYSPLFERIKTKAIQHMNSEGLSEIHLGTYTGLVFRKDGNFYDSKRDIITTLRELPEIYQKESDYIAGQADNRSYVTPSIHLAMNYALSRFREKVKKSLADVL